MLATSADQLLLRNCIKVYRGHSKFVGHGFDKFEEKWVCSADFFYTSPTTDFTSPPGFA